MKRASPDEYTEGRCYELAGRALLSSGNKKLTLVHGTALNRLGIRLAHAWLELPDGSPVAGGAVRAPIAEQRYSKRSSAQKMVEHRHWGPWP